MNERLSDLIANLHLKRIWLRHTHTFNWAHKPLCDRFKPGILNIGKMHVCRSCLFAYIGIFLATIIACVYPLLITDMKLTWLLLSLAPVIILSYPSHYKKLTRSLQDVLRLAMGTYIGFVPFFLIYRNCLCGIPTIILTLIFWRIYFYQRKMRKLHACDGCPELNSSKICSGFEQQAAAIRLYEIEATDLIYRSNRGYPTKMDM